MSVSDYFDRLPGARDAATCPAVRAEMHAARQFVSARDFTDLRKAVNAMRTAANLPTVSFPNDITSGAVVTLAHLTTLRDALDPTRQPLGLPAIPYAEPNSSLVAGSSLIKAAHMLELREGVK